jgi:small subunit ribosomal protein S3
LGQKVHPVGFRLGVSKEWQAKWYADKQYTELILEDLKIRQAIAKKYAADDVSRVEIERSANQVTVTVHTARPGIVIGRGGQRVDEMRILLEQVAGKRVRLNILEIAQPELDAYLVARSIAQQMERRISHRRAMKQAISRAIERGAQGIKITCSGRLSGSEYARKETLHQGRVPLHTLRADIDYALAEAHTTLGRTGVKVWIYKGDIVPEAEKPPIESSLLMTHADRDEDRVEAAVEDKLEVQDATEVSQEQEEETEPEVQAPIDEAGIKVEAGTEEAPKAKKKPKSGTKSKAAVTKDSKEKPKSKKKTTEKAPPKDKKEKKPKAETGKKAKAESKEKPRAKKGAKTKEKSQDRTAKTSRKVKSTSAENELGTEEVSDETPVTDSNIDE